jgi:O-antigen ligase
MKGHAVKYCRADCRMSQFSSPPLVRAPRRPAVPPPANVTGRVARVEPTVLQRVNFAILIAFLFMIFSRILDLYLYWLHLPGIAYRLVGAFLVITGSFLVAFRDSIGKYMLAFTACFLLSIPFGIWRGGSIQVLTDQWLMSFVVFAATASLISDFGQYVRTTKTIAIAILVLTIISIVLGTMENGRLFLERGRFANPNEMAQALLLGMPFWWALYMIFRSPVSKLAAAGILALMLYVIAETGSRGALISVVVIVAFLFVRASLAGKMKLLVSAAVLLALAVLVLPGGLKARYQTFFSQDDSDAETDASANQSIANRSINDSTMLGSAVASANSRKDMLVRSLVITLHHPILGVGPGNFPVEENAMARAEGKRRGAWLGTHNTFTEVSSECGIPALFCYAGIVAVSFRKTYSLYRRTKLYPEFKEIGSHALGLNYSLIAFTITGMFVHAAYTALLPVLAGLTVSLLRTAEPLLPRKPRAPMPTVIARRARPSTPRLSPAGV